MQRRHTGLVSPETTAFSASKAALAAFVTLAFGCGDGGTGPGGRVTQMEVVSGTEDVQVVVGTEVPPVVFRAEDEFGSPVSNFTFTMYIVPCNLTNGFSCYLPPAPGELANSPTLKTGADGTAAFSGWTIDTIWTSIACVAAYAGTRPPTPATNYLTTYCVSPLPGPPARLATNPGLDHQQAPAGTTLKGMGAGAYDRYGNVLTCKYISSYFCVSGRDVQFTFTPSAGGQVSASQVTGMGYAAVDWTITSGANTLTISTDGLSVVYSATGT